MRHGPERKYHFGGKPTPDLNGFGISIAIHCLLTCLKCAACFFKTTLATAWMLHTKNDTLAQPVIHVLTSWARALSTPRRKGGFVIYIYNYNYIYI